MTRKDYVLIAEAINLARHGTDKGGDIEFGVDLVAQLIAAGIARVNPGFKPDVFLKAAGVQS